MASESDWRALYPFASHEIRLRDGLRYHYLDEGSGPALLLVHGNPTWSFYWREIVQALRGQYRLIVPDHIGCGLSDKPRPGEYPYRLARRIEDLLTLIERLDLRQVALLGHDWGGAIGLGAAVARPERFARFVLFNTAAFRSTRMPLRIRLCRMPVLGRLGVQGLNLFSRAALWMAVEKRASLAPPVRAGLLAPYDTWAHRAGVYEFVHDIPLHPGHPSYTTLAGIEAGLAQFRNHPVSLIWGMRDWCFTPHFLQRFREFFPAAEAHPIDDAGHYVIEEAPTLCVRLVRDFLARHPLPPAS